ncbi:glutathione peroxidase [Bdellovibrio svalbardensis]|uniref:Glutathione peroxidase n=1 Tax=Bdellovibrio svalbardensis TaxID=2972972 RepID=A0ABT6DHW4_9BACT|nr:glutathione peroxidase [Bdellovibrio svalbardensis]MDG0816417.1 glutathione peroxidase [Bdellovibrio svalbardensis]
MSGNVHDFKVADISGKPVQLEQYKGKVLLIVNTASKCGLTPQYTDLASLYEKYKNNGLEILGFPANEFAGQEPGSNDEIKDFCTMNFGIKFPMFSKVVVKGEGQHPLYNYLTQTIPHTTKNPDSHFEKTLNEYGEFRTNPSDVLWNFEKFLIGRDGKVVGRFAPDMNPHDEILTKAIEKALA